MTERMPYEILGVAIGFTLTPSSTDALFLSDSVRGLLDTGKLGGDEYNVNVTPDVKSVEIFQGVNRADGPVLRYDQGTATVVLDNQSRDYDPTNTAGPYVTAGETQVKPMRPVWISAEYAEVDYSLFTGFSDSWDIDWNGPNWSQVTIPCTDGFKVLDNFPRSAVAAVGGSEDAGARVSRILDSASWPTADRVISTGDTTLQATTLDGSPLAELQAVADNEIGELYIRGDGKLVFRNRNAILEETRSSTSQATFGDGGGGELPYKDGGLQLAYDHDTLINKVVATRAGGSEQVVEDVASQDEFLIRGYTPPSELILETDPATADWAGFVLSISSQPELRFTEVTIWPRVDPDNLYPQVLGRQIGDRITIRRRPPGGGPMIERDVFIRGIRHVVTPDNWITTWTLQSATRYAFFVLDTSELDTGVLGF